MHFAQPLSHFLPNFDLELSYSMMKDKTTEIVKKAMNFKDLLRDFSLHMVIKPMTEIESETHFELSNHLVMRLETYQNTLKCISCLPFKNKKWQHGTK